MADHDYAACQNELCVRCEAFGDGYRQGKGWTLEILQAS